MTRQDLLKNKHVYKQGQFVVIIHKDYYQVLCQVNDMDDFESIKNFDMETYIKRFDKSVTNRKILGAVMLIDNINMGTIEL